MSARPSLLRRINAGLALSCLLAGAGAGELGAGPRQLFTATPAGTYALPAIQRAPAGRVFDSDGQVYDFGRFCTGRVTLLSFMYTYCSDPVGCPLAFSTMHTLRQRLQSAPQLARRVRFVSLSFDPSNDTPEAMRRYAGPLAKADNVLQWYFLTTASVRQLAPLADGFGQSVRVLPDSQGRPGRFISHMLKVFLLDEQGRVREIYSTAFLQPDVMFNDIKTLLMERDRAAARPHKGQG
ncbi:SCO family protein [Janthinobacterium fluminis]|uniref:SCO family protein n=1 Tax=Janthinobacterium fluminis TaxID=2987524 RepID=A0ABT5JWF1_9BURK|nr:SCO family protein [Janthinobacterium fluminis]MDC8756884.1 SCO family protein [Janthinobacterium fluminis]